MKWLVVGAVALSLVLVSSSQAHPLAGQGQMKRIAAKHFDPICKPARIISTHASSPRPVDAWANTWRCTIVLYPSAHDLSYTEACALIVHEYGHLAGKRHSRNPFNIMFPVVEPVAAPGC